MIKNVFIIGSTSGLAKHILEKLKKRGITKRKNK